MSILVVVLTLILLALSWKYILRLEPAGVFAAMWIFFFAAVLLMQHYIELRYEGILFIAGCVILFVLGTLSCDAVYHPKASPSELIFRKERALPLLLLLFAGAMLNPLYSILLHGFSLQALLDMRELLEMNKGISEDRYFQGGVSNAANQFFLIFCYAAPLMGGFCYRLVGRWTKGLCLLTLIPGIFIALTQSMKMGMITGFVLWFTGYFVCSFSYGLSMRIRPRNILYATIGMTTFFAILFISMVFRTGEVSEKTLQEISQKFMTYALGHFHCFDMWYTTHEPASYTLGTRTLMGISNVLGLEERMQGVYQEYYQIGKNGYHGISNIFTVFRPLIEDFGEAGACLFMFFTGFLSKLSLTNLIGRRNVFLNQVIITAAYAYLLWSFGASFFAYTSYVAMFFLAYILFRLLQQDRVPCGE